MFSKSRTTISPIVLAASVFLEILIALVALSVVTNSGKLIYNLDDSYIHMAMAKNFALYNVWGITPYEFSSSTSSPLWTLMLSFLYRIFGINDYIPLIMNILFAIGILVFIHRALTTQNTPAWFNRYLLIAIVFLMPLPTLALAGMEHILHTWVMLAFIFVAAQFIVKSEGSLYTARHIVLMALAALVTSIRYESIFVIFVVCLLLILRRRWLDALIVAGCGALPIGIYGLFSVANGSLFLPNSVLIKGYRPDLSSISGIISQFGLIAFHQLVTAPHLLALALLNLVLMHLSLRRKGYWSNSGAIIGTIFIAILLLHLQFARIEWFYRYEAYLVVIGLFSASILAAPFVPEIPDIRRWVQSQNILVGVILFFFLLPLITRSISALRETPGAMHEIYLQQYQMADFLKRYYSNQGIAIHDIGLIDYEGDYHVLDVTGLGTIEVARARLANDYNLVQVEQLCREKKIEMAIVYEGNFPPPPSWRRIASWRINTPGPVITVGDKTVTFFAIAPGEDSKLVEHLKEYAANLPSEIAVTYY